MSDFLKMLQALQQQQQKEAAGNQGGTFSEKPLGSSGFSFWDTYSSINTNIPDQKAICVGECKATLVTKQCVTIDSANDVKFSLRILQINNRPFGICIVPANSTKMSCAHNFAGSRDIQDSIAVVVPGGGERATMVRNGDITVADMGNGWCVGTVLTICLNQGEFLFLKDGVKTGKKLTGLNGRFRFGVCMSSPGQEVEVVDGTSSGSPRSAPSSHDTPFSEKALTS
eukprot:PhF_6_TR36064/c0_g1_i3/m.52355